MDQRLKGVVSRGSAAEVGRGCGWVVAEVAPVMTFLNGFAPVGFKSAPVMIFFYRRGFVFVCVCVSVCVCGLWVVLEGEGA